MTWSIQPDPREENERAALVDAAERALADGADSPLAASRWWRDGLEAGLGGAAAEEPRRDAGVVEA